MSTGEVTEEVSESFAQLTHGIVAVGGTVVVPAKAGWLSAVSGQQTEWKDGRREGWVSPNLPTFQLSNQMPTLAYGQRVEKSGFHIMETPTDQPTETLTGLGATGVDLALAHIVGAPLQSHVMVPLIQVSTDATTQATYGADLDLSTVDVDDLLALIVEVASRTVYPETARQREYGFSVDARVIGDFDVNARHRK